MPRILFLKGLPASGKSTWAKEYCLLHPEFSRVNKDDIRETVGMTKFDYDLEKKVLSIERELGMLTLLCGGSLIVDDTNFAKKHERFWRQFSTQNQFEMTCLTFNTPVEECIRRDEKREKSVGKDVILNMQKQKLKNEEDEFNLDINAEDYE